MLAGLLVAAAAAIIGVDAISKITRSGRYLYSDDGNRFYIKGVAYQPQGGGTSSGSGFSEPTTFIDPLSSTTNCTRDIPNLQALGVNTVRVYSVDSTLDHDGCMAALSSAGIYTIIDLTLPINGSIARNSPSWSTNLLDLYINTIDVFSKYDNVLAYNVGNEVVLGTITFIAPYVKAAARDTKAYLASISSSALVGYAAIDGAGTFRDPLANYLSCDPSGNDSGDTALDIYGLNNYEWCGNDTFQGAYAGVTGDFAGYNVVAYFSEYGSVLCSERLWTEVAALFSSDMAPVWSGGVAFSYFPAESDQGQFGMVTYNADGSVSTGDDFSKLAAQYQAVSFINSPSQASSTASTYPACPTTNSTWLASTSLPPTPNEPACDCLENTLTCQFTPVTSNYVDIVGELINEACNLLGQKGASCNDIGGGNGTYGRLSGCDPTIQLSFVMSEWYELNNFDSQACSFAGNGTVNAKATPSVSAANAAASSCVPSPNAVFTPSAPSTTPTSGNSATTSTSSSSSGNGSGSKNNGAISEHAAIVGLVVATCISGLSAILLL